MYPNRARSHLVETKSSRVFQSMITAEWMLRQLSEADYGIDFLLEFPGLHNQINGRVAAIQLKGAESISFNRSGFYHLGGIKRSTLNLWLGYESPVMLVMVDVTSGVVYFKSIEDEFRGSYGAYIDNCSDTVAFDFYPSDLYDSGAMLLAYETARLLRRMDGELPSVISLYQEFARLHISRYRRDEHMPVDGDGSYNPSSPSGQHRFERRLRDLYDRVHQSSILIDLSWSIPPVEEIMRSNAWEPSWGDEMYEVQFTAVLDHLDDQIIAMRAKLSDIVDRYPSYWKARRAELVEFARTQHTKLSSLYWSDREQYRRLCEDI